MACIRGSVRLCTGALPTMAAPGVQPRACPAAPTVEARRRLPTPIGLASACRDRNAPWLARRSP
eukprot:1574202-Pleurochrysis_carterae.AAC.2